MPKRFALAATLAALLLVLAVPAAAWAGSPHFVLAATGVTEQTATSLTVAFKEAGLGSEPQVHVVLSAQVQCVNPGGQPPQAGNKQAFSVAGDFPVQNGRAEGSLTLRPVLQPACQPPMTLAFTDVVLTDTTSGISLAL
jgi:hypothetical protein